MRGERGGACGTSSSDPDVLCLGGGERRSECVRGSSRGGGSADAAAWDEGRGWPIERVGAEPQEGVWPAGALVGRRVLRGTRSENKM